MQIELTNLTDILNRIEELAPRVLDIYQRQVYANIVSTFIWAFALVVAALVLFLVGRHYRTKALGLIGQSLYDAEDTMMGAIGLFIVSAVCAFLSLWFITILMQMLINPDYYALKMLLGTFGLR